jgi:hypothetical protein
VKYEIKKQIEFDWQNEAIQNILKQFEEAKQNEINLQDIKEKKNQNFGNEIPLKTFKDEWTHSKYSSETDTSK